MNCIKIIYKEENGKVTINEVDNYINKQGIWALFGKREDIFEFCFAGGSFHEFLVGIEPTRARFSKCHHVRAIRFGGSGVCWFLVSLKAQQ